MSAKEQPYRQAMEVQALKARKPRIELVSLGEASRRLVPAIFSVNTFTRKKNAYLR